MENSKWKADMTKAIEDTDFENVEKAIEILKEARANGKHIFIIGNGGGVGTHFAADMFKIGRSQALCLNDNIPLLSALTNDNGWENVYTEQLKRLMNRGDVLIVQSVHGGKGKDLAGNWSENLTKAVDYANKLGKTISIVGFDGGILKEISTVCIHVPIDSTPIVESMQGFMHHIIAFEMSEGDRK